MDAGKKTITDVISRARILEIPFFQRPYVWGEEQWERLVEDLEELSVLNKPHFLGSIILKQLETAASEEIGDRRLLVDGQQRLTTLLILFKVTSLMKDGGALFNSVCTTYQGGIPIIHNHLNQPSFNRVLELESLEKLDSAGDRIIEAYEWFRKKVDHEKLNLNRILSHVQFVGIDLSVDEDEQLIFDTINSLGIKLTSAELLKNYLYRREDLADYRTEWKEVFERDEDLVNYWDTTATTGRVKKTFVDLFLHSLLQILAERAGIQGEERAYYFKSDRVFQKYKDLVEGEHYSRADLRREVADYGRVFSEHFSSTVMDRGLNDNPSDRLVALMMGCDASTLAPYVLYLLKHQSDVEERQKVCEILESFICRRLMCRITSSSYSKLFYVQLIGANACTAELLTENLLKREGTDLAFPSNASLRTAIYESKLLNRNARGLLYMMESKTRHRDQATQLHGMGTYTLEHIMPKKWKEKWPQLDSELDEVKRNEKLRKIGNLCILPSKLNTRLSNSSWGQKRDGDSKNPGLKKLAQGLELMADWVEKEEWDESVIDSRAKFLYSKMIEAWPALSSESRSDVNDDLFVG